MLPRKRIELILRHEEADCVPIQDNIWPATIKRWQMEGLPRNTTVDDYFDYEMTFIGVDLSPRFPVREIERTQDYVVETTPYGGTRKNLLVLTSVPEMVNWPVKNRGDWYKIKSRLFPDGIREIGINQYFKGSFEEAFSEYLKWRKAEKFICFAAGFGFCHLTEYIKMDELLMIMVTDKDLFLDMMKTHTDLVIAMLEKLIERDMKFDGVFIFNDLGYRNGLLFSPAMFRELHLPLDKILCDFCHSHNLPVILHSDGNLNELIPLFIEAGYDCLNPLEIKAGMDLIGLKGTFGDKISLMGGIDARIMADDFPSHKMEEEIKNKISIAKVKGGYIYHSDHSVPPNVSFERYKKVIRLVKEYGSY